jgi:ABC-type polysaccharide/polyol phosphate export permease
VGVAATAFNDLAGSVIRLPLAMQLALDDVHGKYRRTILGPLWIVLGQAITVLGFVVLLSGLFSQDPTGYALYLAAGFPIWNFIAQYLIDMPTAFLASRGVIESYELPWLLHIWRRSFGYLLVLLHQLLILFAAMAILKVTPSINMLYAFPAVGILLIAGSGIGLLFAVAGARYRDLQPAMGAVAGFLFLFSPIFWRASELREEVAWAYQFNPVYYFVTVLRDPLLGQIPEPRIWVIAGTGAIALFVIGFLAFLLCRRRLYHWL